MSFFFDRIGELKELSLPLNEFVFIQNLFVLARKKKELPVFEQVEITDIAAEGKAVARVNDLVVFIPYGAPGDIVDLQIYRKKH